MTNGPPLLLTMGDLAGSVRAESGRIAFTPPLRSKIGGDWRIADAGVSS